MGISSVCMEIGIAGEAVMQFMKRKVRVRVVLINMKPISRVVNRLLHMLLL